MLDKTGTRQLCYVVYIDAIEPIVGSDNCEAAVVGGWKVMVRKGTFKVNDPAVYFEIDSKVDTSKPEFAFLEKKHGAIKTQKYTFGGQNPGFYSQGLLMAAADFGWTIDYAQFASSFGYYIVDNKGMQHIPGTDSAFLTEQLGVTYYEPEDNKRKAKSNPNAKINAALARHPKIAKRFGKFIKKHQWARKFFLLLFGKKKDEKVWPAWVVKTDEERVQNMPWILSDKSEWFATEKIDGTSTTFTMRGEGRKRQFYICSRNVCFDTPEKMAKGAWYDTNVYQEMAIKYDIENVLADMLNNFKELDFVTIQGETYGGSIQKRDYSTSEHNLMVFNLIYGYKIGSTRRCNPREMTEVLAKYKIPCVPIVDEHFVLPNTVDELLAIATGNSKVDGLPREGLVFRSYDGTQSFKAVSNEFLIKYHG